MTAFKKVPTDDVRTTELFIPTVIKATRCESHGAGYAVACYHIPTLNGKWTLGICNTRALKAGMNGPINPESLDRSIARQKYAKRS